MADPSAGGLPPDVLQQLATGLAHLNANKYYVLASTTMLVYDHILTFDEELTYMWRRQKSFPFYLFLIFRYFTPVISILNIPALHSPGWTGSLCEDWIWIPVAVGPIVSLATGVIMILRVHAIYSQASWVLWLTVPIYLGQLAVMGWAIPAGAPAQLPPGFVGCVPSPKPGTGIRLSSIYIAALVFDATIFVLTLSRAVYYRLTGSLIPLITLVIRDGTLYFAVIFAVNLANVFLLSLAPPDLSAINAPFASMITATLVARLMLNLRQAANVQVHTKASTGASITFGSGTGRSSRNITAFHAATTPGQTTTFLERMGAEELAVPLPDTIFKTSRGTTSVSEASSDWTDNVQEAYQMT